MWKYVWTLVVVIGLAGCGVKQVEYVDRPVEVKVPVKCTVEVPRLEQVEVSPAGLRELAIYTEKLECALNECRGSPCK